MESVKVSQPAMGVCVGARVGNGVSIDVGVWVGMDVLVGNDGGVGVRVSARIVTADPDEGRSVRVFVPVETRAVQLIVVCPACSALTSKVKTTPLVVSLLP